MATSSYNHQPQRAPLGMSLNTSTPTGKRGKVSPEKPDLELRIATLERERREIHQELFEAAQVQRRLSGPRQLRRGPFEIASEVFPVRHLAGDFVSAMDVGKQTWIALGDIAGKGLAAAMWFTHLVSLIRCHATLHSSTAAVMSDLNADLCALQPEPPFTSIVLIALDRDSRQLQYCNAGHPAPLLLRRGADIERLETGGPLLGVVSGAGYESGCAELRPGDLLVGCTDGILECRNAADDEFGHARLVQEARAHADDSAQTVLFSILGAVQDFAADAPRRDDVSLLVIRAGEHRRR